MRAIDKNLNDVVELLVGTYHANLEYRTESVCPSLK